jgi:hypothetical protein
MEIGSSYPETKTPPAVYKSQEVFLIYRDEVLSKDFVPCLSQDGGKNDK